MDQPLKRVFVYGGTGALGARCVSHFKANNFWVGSIGFTENTEADCNIIVRQEQSFQQQEETILASVKAALNGSKIDGIFCVAGGWASGNASKNLAKTSELMWQQNVCTSLITVAIAANYLKNGGVVQLTGAKAALKGTPEMIGYGVAKAAVHQLTKSLAEEESGLPKGALIVAVLPAVLDTPRNRKNLPKADFSNWTSPQYIAELFLLWVSGKNRPQNGSLLQLETTNFNTELLPVYNSLLNVLL